MQNIAESVEAVDDETGGNAIDRISSFFEDGAAAAVGWWESLPLWQQIVVPLGAGLALAMVVGAVCSIYCCCRKKRKAREDHRHTIDFSKYGNSDAQADIRVHV